MPGLVCIRYTIGYRSVSLPCNRRGSSLTRPLIVWSVKLGVNAQLHSILQTHFAIAASIDKSLKSGYTKENEGATGRRFPRSCYKEVTACLEAGRLLLFIFCLDNQGDKCDKENAELKQFLPCNHTDHPLSFDWGREASPP